MDRIVVIWSRVKSRNSTSMKVASLFARTASARSSACAHISASRRPTSARFALSPQKALRAEKMRLLTEGVESTGSRWVWMIFASGKTFSTSCREKRSVGFLSSHRRSSPAPIRRSTSASQR